MSADVFFLQMTAVINLHTRSCTLADTAKEADLMLSRALKGTPAGRIEAMGFRIKPVMVTVQVLPDSTFVPPLAEQGEIFD